MDEVVLDKVKNLLISKTCTGLDFQGEFGPLLFKFETLTLYIGTAYRVIKENKLIAGSGSQDKIKETLRETLVGRKVLSINIKGNFYDLSLQFEGNIIFETFADSGEYENWNLIEGPTSMVIVGPGNSWSAW